MRDGTAEYVRIAQQATTVATGGGRPVEEFVAALSSHGFPVTRSTDMDGWLAYHAVCVASVAAALYRCAGNAVALADDRSTIVLMCRAIEEGFRALRRTGVRGLPRNLRTLHLAVLRPRRRGCVGAVLVNVYGTMTSLPRALPATSWRMASGVSAKA